MLDRRHLVESDSELNAAILLELSRQQNCLELIASENYVSQAVLEAAGSILTNKYAEGYPSKRYYGGCEYVDIVENLARERAKQLFGAEYANVQPHCGSGANMAAYRALMKHGDTILSMELSQGGHLSHGSAVSFSGIDYNIVSYGVGRDSETIDYDNLRELALKHQPRIIVAGASAYPRTLNFKKFREIADEAGALLVSDMAHIAGLVAVGEHPSPVPHSHITTCTTHKTLRGPRGGLILIGKLLDNDMGITAKQSGKVKNLGEIVDSVVFPGLQGGPLPHIIAAKAASFNEALGDNFKTYQKSVKSNASTLASHLVENGLRLVSGGTDNHLMLVDLSSMNVSGRKAEKWLDIAGITVNKNMIPYDPKPPGITSGIRVGTAAITSRGLGEAHMPEVASYIAEALKSNGDEVKLGVLAGKVKELCNRFPVY
ncbi:Serine hydroxymethyltransferase [Olavius algarvensis spirochete endosymbiont]|uniref:serine hydroxymethyltransferase n=1 Tax=Olavius algarvensis spirochete endosymbiont TaxID=260710 RepID=UPI00052C41C0|nr:serine hydroxymethyltransferase [Alkalispirochaeta odontotermitis]VDA99251.1 Serine hydroxymethyltransferase [Olavius algarvensis spirochete endosymbiont]